MPVLIHTVRRRTANGLCSSSILTVHAQSGLGVLADDARGEYASDTIYSDLNVQQLKSIPETAFHRTVDLRVIDADQTGYVRCHIVLPSTVYGVAKHALVEAGVANPHSIQIPTIIRASLRRGRAGVVGKGLALWPSVHTTDREFPSLASLHIAHVSPAGWRGSCASDSLTGCLPLFCSFCRYIITSYLTYTLLTVAEIYMILFDNILKNPDKVGHGWQGFYFAENGEHPWLDISKAVGQAMHELKLTDNPEPTRFTVDELKKYFGFEEMGWYFGSNVRARADRGRELGWKPKCTTKDMLASIKHEVVLNAKKA